MQKNGCWQLAASIKFCITARSAQRTERDRNDIKHHRLKKKQDERMETTRKHIHGFGTTSFNLNTVTNKYACDKCKLEFQKTKRHLPEHCAKQQGIINAGKRPKVTDSREHSLKRQHIDRNKLDTTTTTTNNNNNNTNTNTTNNNLSNRHDGNREEDLAAAAEEYNSTQNNNNNNDSDYDEEMETTTTTTTTTTSNEDEIDLSHTEEEEEEEKEIDVYYGHYMQRVRDKFVPNDDDNYNDDDDDEEEDDDNKLMSDSEKKLSVEYDGLITDRIDVETKEDLVKYKNSRVIFTVENNDNISFLGTALEVVRCFDDRR